MIHRGTDSGPVRRRFAVGLAAAAACALAVGVWLATARASPAAPGPPAAVPTGPSATAFTAVPGGPAAPKGATSVTPLPPLTDAPVARIAPVSVEIPAIGLRTPLIHLHLRATGELVPPTNFGDAGWFSEGAAPGEPGPAVLAGHVDSRAGPAIFYRLSELKPGDAVLVHRADGSTLRYTVSVSVRYPKAHFPTALVYNPVPATELRLITCGGSFDYAKRSYRDNIVVSAVAQPA